MERYVHTHVSQYVCTFIMEILICMYICFSHLLTCTHPLRELEASPETLGRCNAIFDESGHFLVSRLVLTLRCIITQLPKSQQNSSTKIYSMFDGNRSIDGNDFVTLIYRQREPISNILTSFMILILLPLLSSPLLLYLFYVNFKIYGALTGIKILNLVTNRVVKVLGTSESGERFLTVALYQVSSVSNRGQEV